MKISKVRKMYSIDLDKMISRVHGEQFLKDFQNTYYYQKIRDIFYDVDIYVRDYEKSKPRLRLTFPFFITAVIILTIVMAIVWLFTGSSTLQDKWWITKAMIKWDKHCNFNIVA